MQRENAQSQGGAPPPPEILAITDLHRRAASEPGNYTVKGQVSAFVRKLTKSGKAYYDISLADGAGTLALKAWSDSDLFEEAGSWPPGDAGIFLEITGHWEVGNFGLEPKGWTSRRLNPAEAAAVLAGDAGQRATVEREFHAIVKIVSTLADPRLRALCDRFLDRFGERFQRAAGARRFHHARRGGLVEHVAQMMRAALAVCDVYPALNRDLLVAGALFHDCGKLWENCYPRDGFAMPFSLRGELLGHIPMGIELANKLWQEILEVDEARAAAWQQLDPAPDAVRLHLLHLIGAHHGELEFGSPVTPRTPEASALHYIDNLDAKLEMFARGFSTAAEIAPGIHERVFPLPGPLVRPLRAFSPDPPAGAEDGGEEIADYSI